MRLLLVSFFFAYALPASTLNPVKWSISAEPAEVDGGNVLLKLHAEIAAAFHLYSLTTPPGGPIRTRVRILGEGTTATEVYQPKPETRMDSTLHINVETFTGSADFLIPASLGASRQRPLSVSLSVRYQACSDEICLPPVERTTEVVIPAGHAVPHIPPGYQRVAIKP